MADLLNVLFNVPKILIHPLLHFGTADLLQPLLPLLSSLRTGVLIIKTAQNACLMSASTNNCLWPSLEAQVTDWQAGKQLGTESCHPKHMKERVYLSTVVEK